MRRTTSIIATVAALSCAALGCASESDIEIIENLAEDPNTVAFDFEGTVDVTAGTMTLRFLDSVPGSVPADEVGSTRDPLTEVTVVGDGVAGSGPVDTAELVTVASGSRATGSTECGTVPGGIANCFFGDVDLRHFFATRHLSNAYVQITAITAGYEGYGGVTSTTLGLDATRGLWRYGTLEPNAAGFTNFVSQRRWRFRQPTAANFTFTGRVFATLQTPGAVNAPFLASVDEQGRKATADSRAGCITNDGRFTVFSTTAALVASDTNGLSDIYRYDVTNGNLVLVSLRSTGAVTTTGSASTPCLSNDGNIIVFASTATDMVASDTNGVSDIFARNVTAGTTTAVSTTTSGTIPQFCTSTLGTPLSGAGSFRPSISSDGRFVAFDSTCARLCGQTTATPSAANTAAGCQNGRPHVYRKDRNTGTTTIVSVVNGSTTLFAGAGAPITSINRDNQLRASISDDGNRVVFDSNALNLVPGITTETRNRDVYLRVISANTTTRLTNDCNLSSRAAISGNGTAIAFVSDCAQSGADTNTGSDVYRFVPTGAITGVTTAGTLSILSVNTAGAQTAGSSASVPRISTDGCRTVFRSNGGFDGAAGINSIFQRDACTSTTRLVSRSGEGVAANGSSDSPMISGNGAFTTFETSATNLSTDGATAFDGANIDVYFVRN